MRIDFTYSKEQYMEDVLHYSLTDIWTSIFLFLKEHGETDFLTVSSLSDLYELALSLKDKNRKKQRGVYYTPSDVSDLMADFYLESLCDDAVICDVCAGTGNLVLSVLSKMDERQRNHFLSDGRVYLYDLDDLALAIAKFRIGFYFGEELADKVRCICCDFLRKDVILPKNSRVVSNPPYFRIAEFSDDWNLTPIMKASKEFYSVFMEKCVTQADFCVFITPYSFVSGSKFFLLRELFNNTLTKIFVFDNVPGNIFRGRKHGIFNSNQANATRAAISVINTTQSLGTLVSPMIRFLSSERSRILSKSVLESLLDLSYYQKVSLYVRNYYKCFSEDIPALFQWQSSSEVFEDLLAEEPTPYVLTMPTTCRYFTVASFRGLQRDGKYILYFKNADCRNYAYVLLNSSFAYWYWRVYDGAITYPFSLLCKVPCNFGNLSEEQKKEMADICAEVSLQEENYLIYKKNGGRYQENVKFPDEIRNRLNRFMISVLDIPSVDFDKVHSRMFFRE